LHFFDKNGFRQKIELGQFILGEYGYIKRKKTVHKQTIISKHLSL
jgi:hypothetical protein